ncbi:hypothetical protein I4U23_015132 [Adineta vaga]|nr:hypothetical protein I4U23_015132 [Adineta vaga]
MSYRTNSSPVDQFVINSKLLCIARCTHQISTCNIVVFDRLASPSCKMFNEAFVAGNLVASATGIIVNFNRFYADEVTTVATTTSTTTTTTTTKTTTTTTTTKTTTTTTTTKTTTTTTTTKTTTTTTKTTTTVTVLLSLSGVQLNLNPNSLPNGWSLCYNATYSSSMTSLDISTILSSCNQAKLLLGCREVNNETLAVAAMGNRADVLYDCNTTSSCTHVANGVGWYFSDSYSWGFVNGSDTVSRSSCDTQNTNAEYRLCWHTKANGGYRCGATTNTGSSWMKVIYHSN